ncbi:MAG: hypothetical protein EKK46_05730 [Rhodocyclaceae bacterium]|nr:MAG: hypothetical protein EKK46_05730 [Rhodocyclaceae bacterium]
MARAPKSASPIAKAMPGMGAGDFPPLALSPLPASGAGFRPVSAFRFQFEMFQFILFMFKQWTGVAQVVRN